MVCMCHLDSNTNWLMQGPSVRVQESLLLRYMGPLLSHVGSRQVSAVITFFRNREKKLHRLCFLLQPLHFNSAVA